MNTKIKVQMVFQTYYMDETYSSEAISSREKRTETHYDVDGRIIQEIQYDHQGKPETKTTKEYNEHGSIVRTEIYDYMEDVSEVFETSWRNPEQKLSERRIYMDGASDLTKWEYTESGELQKKTLYGPEGEPEQTTNYVIQNAKIISEVVLDEEGELVQQDHYEYDSNGLILVHTHESAEEGVSVTKNTYNEKGKLIETIITDEEDDIIEHTKISESDEDGLITYTQETPSGISLYKISNDSSGRMIQQEEFDEEDNQISNIKRKYLPDGNVSQTLGMIYRSEFGARQYYSLDYEYEFYEN